MCRFLSYLFAMSALSEMIRTQEVEDDHAPRGVELFDKALALVPQAMTVKNRQVKKDIYDLLSTDHDPSQAVPNAGTGLA